MTISYFSKVDLHVFSRSLRRLHHDQHKRVLISNGFKKLFIKQFGERAPGPRSCPRTRADPNQISHSGACYKYGV